MKRILLAVFQASVTAVVLFFVFRDPGKRAQMFEALQQSDKIWLLAAFASFGAVEVLAAVRWALLLRVQGIVLPNLRLFALFMIGAFFNMFMPGGTGGDVVKIFYLMRETPGRTAAAILATLMDRVLGLLSLMTLTVVLVALRYRWLMQTPLTAGLLYTLLLILAISLGSVALSFVVTGFGLAHRLPQRMPGRDRLIELSQTYHVFANRWGTALACVAISWGVHFGSFLVFYFAGRSFRLTTSLLDFCAIMPIVNTITALPISLSGVGVREKLFEDLLGNLCGIEPGVAVMVSVTGFLALLTWGLIGGLIYLFYRPSTHPKIAEITVAVARAEHRLVEPPPPDDAR